jgi:SAM-dependent methyltransferase
MTASEDLVAEHYGTTRVLENILTGLERAGFPAGGALAPADLKPIDEFHTGGLQATEALLEQLAISPGDRVLDIGCGIGGTARHLADRYGVRVTGVDLTPEYVETARYLSRSVGLEDRVEFGVGSATELAVEPAAYDLAIMLHVGMNVADKPAMFRGVANALKASGVFGVFDVMRDHDPSEIVFPLPWAERAETSFVEPPEVYFEAAEAAGFRLVAERNRATFAIEFFRSVFDRIEREGPPVLGIHLLMGETASEKIRNYIANLEAERIAPREMIFEKT